jgi:acyl-CoA thioester hydrolase
MLGGEPETIIEAEEGVGTPVVFTLPLRVQESDLDAMNHVNNVVYLRWVQEVAAAHWFAAATPEQQAGLVWVVMRHEIDYLRPALLGEELVARTWVGELTGARFTRHVEIWRPQDNQLLARARSVWVALDARAGRPRRVDEAVRRRFYVPD